MITDLLVFATFLSWFLYEFSNHSFWGFLILSEYWSMSRMWSGLMIALQTIKAWSNQFSAMKIWVHKVKSMIKKLIKSKYILKRWWYNEFFIDQLILYSLIFIYFIALIILSWFSMKFSMKICFEETVV